jgi:hypothetical protein
MVVAVKLLDWPQAYLLANAFDEWLSLAATICNRKSSDPEAGADVLIVKIFSQKNGE